MSTKHANEWWYCLRHRRVEPWEGCKDADRLGPYASPEAAEHALQTVAERNEAWDEEDARWDDDD
ncbi:MAG TPA: hypothetical protein VI076_07915 [Actinopolymorphaceae bacterium]